MNLHIRLATPQDAHALGKLYDELTAHLEANTNYPGWKNGVYPVRQDAVDGIAASTLYVATDGAQIAGTLILNHAQEPAYASAAWHTLALECEVLVIHTFAVSPQYLHCGVGEALLAFASQHATDNGIKALRLDVYEKNLPAIRLYEKCGYCCVGTVSLGLEEYGLEWFLLYEKEIVSEPLSALTPNGGHLSLENSI